MNRKQFIILLVLVVVIGAAGLVIRQRGQTSWQSAGQTLGQKLLPNLAVNDIAQVSIKSGTNQLTLAKRDGQWCVRERGDYPANFTEISSLLLKFAELKVVQSQEVGASQLGRLELQPPSAGANSGTLVELKDQGGRLLGSILIGKKRMSKPGGEGWPDGRYVMAGADAKSAAVISDTLDNVQPKPEQWLNKEFLGIEKPRSIAVQFAEATNSWKLTRSSETNDWQLTDAKGDEKLDSSKTSSVISPFSSPTFNDVSQSETVGDNVTTLTVETFDGFIYVAKIGASAVGNYPVKLSVSAELPGKRVADKDEKPEDKTRLDKEFSDHQAKLNEKLTRETRFTNWVYHLPGYVVDSLLKPRADLLLVEQTAPKVDATE
jgi:hypothetical protein